MSKICAAAAAAIAVLALFAFMPCGTSDAQSEYASPDGTYSYVTGGAGSPKDPYRCKITALEGGGGTLWIQSALEGYPVRTIESLRGCASSSIVIPQTVTSLEPGAFGGCANLETAVFLGDRPSGDIPPSIRVVALQGASGWGPGTEQLVLRVFVSGPSSFSYYVLGGGAHVFGPVSGREFSIPSEDTDGNRFVSISAEAFRDTDITSVTMGDGIKEIGVRAFYGCIKLKTAVLPHSIRNIRDEGFRYCPVLGNVDLGGTETIGFESFRDCISFTSITVPDTVRSAAGGCFYICSKAEAVKVGTGLESVSERMFGYCDKMTSIEFSRKPASIGAYAFNNCRSLESIDASGASSIGQSAFFGCERLKSISLSPKLSSIEGSAFSECLSLASLKMPSSLKSIGQSAFFHCNSLTDVYFEGPMPQMPSDPFFGASGARVHIDCVYKDSWKPYGGDVVVEGDCVTAYSCWLCHLAILLAIIGIAVFLMRKRLFGKLCAKCGRE